MTKSKQPLGTDSAKPETPLTAAMLDADAGNAVDLFKAGKIKTDPRRSAEALGQAITEVRALEKGTPEPTITTVDVIEGLADSLRAHSDSKGGFIAPDPKTVGPQDATGFMRSALGEMQDRKTKYDKPEGERSMDATVAMFNAMTGGTMSTEQGWKFMICLKLVRSEQGEHRADDYVDGVAYFSLAGEASAK